MFCDATDRLGDVTVTFKCPSGPKALGAMKMAASVLASAFAVTMSMWARLYNQEKIKISNEN